MPPEKRARQNTCSHQRASAQTPPLMYLVHESAHVVRLLEQHLHLADEANQRILRFDPGQNTVTPILGKGVEKPNRGLSKPHGVYFHTDGTIYVVDTGHHRILRVTGR